MTQSPTISIPINANDSSGTGHARRVALALARSTGFSEVRQGELGIIVTEAAGNIAAHVGEGEITLSPWHHGGDAGIDVLALDRGKGMSDVGRSIEDGYSTAGSAGEGLGAISRLAGTFQIYSSLKHGTALLARVLRESPTAAKTSQEFELGVVNVPVSGETRCGDGWSMVSAPGRSIYIMADGLGHGPIAAEAAEEAVRIFREESHLSPERILAGVHLALGKTRGAAVAIAEILHTRSTINYSGIGNIAASIYHAGKSRSMVSMNGTAGHTAGRIQTFSYPWEPNSTLLMHSDGLATRWTIDQYPGLTARHPALVAGVLYRDFCRRRDDVTILVSRI